MEEERIPKKILGGKFHNITLVAKPKTRQEDVVQRDEVQILGI
jgi:protein required for attachment to host cells